MRFSYEIEANLVDVYRVSLTSGEDAFFDTADVELLLNKDIEIVEIDLERINGTGKTSLRILEQIADGIANFIRQNSKSMLYYYCDDLSEIPFSGRNRDISPQEYRSRIFSLMFNRYTSKYKDLDLFDITIEINEDGRPLFMHLIAGRQYSDYVETVSRYILNNYGK